MRNAATVAQYIADTPPAARKALKAIRAAIKSVAPGITERISYRIPTFDLDGKYLLYMAAFREHVSVYRVTPGIISRHGALDPGTGLRLAFCSIASFSFCTASRVGGMTDAVLRLPGASKGADEDVRLARERGLPVYFDISEVPAAA